MILIPTLLMRALFVTFCLLLLIRTSSPFTVFLSSTAFFPSRTTTTTTTTTSQSSASRRRKNRQQHLYRISLSSDTTTTTTTTTDAAASSDVSSSVLVAEQIQLGRDCFAHYFDFPLDDWQLQAGGAIVQGSHVVVSSPTGSGKTVVGEMALLYAYHTKQKKSIYTTPLKALSNQKYADLLTIFGRQHVGLATGDISLNKQNARVTVMTTEVYRNLAWRWQSSSTESSTSSSSSSSDRSLHDTSVVVLDEFHYMGVPGRGGVWEESVITSPSHVQMVALSATLPNAQELARWMQDVTQQTVVLVQVPASQRPVPLRYLYATKEGLFPLFRDPNAGPGAPNGLLGWRGDGVSRISSSSSTTSKSGNKGFGVGSSGTGTKESSSSSLPRGLQVNPALRAASERRMQRVNRAMERQRVERYTSIDNNYDDNDSFDWSPSGGRQRRRGQSSSSSSYRKLSPREERKERERLLKKEMRRTVPSMLAVVQRLEQKNLLPAIFFIFSRVGCDQAARTIYQQMKGPTRDPTKMLPDELEELRDMQQEREKTKDMNSSTAKRKSRKRGQRRSDNLLEDAHGRTFRSGNNYISEDLLQSLFQPNDPLNEQDFDDDSSPLSPENWEFYSKAGLLSYKEIQQVASRISSFNEDNPEIAFDDSMIEQYLFGVGSHHAGMLPAHKSFVEVLYRNQLMKVVFATETLAAGINMPARTTVICSLAKRGDGSSMSLLETSNLLQMAGRAGRRGMDTDGSCVIVPTAFEGHDDAARILTDPIKPIKSQFRPSYSLAVNLIARGQGKLDVARQLVGKSFAMWEKRQIEESIEDTVEKHGEGVSEVLQASAQERFMNTLIDTLQLQVDKRRAKFDIARIQSLLEILTDKELLKKTSKSFVGAAKMLELELTTLGYLEKELVAMQTTLDSEEGREFLGDLLSENEHDLVEQIDIQRKRAFQTEKEVNKHPFSAIKEIANGIMGEDTPEAKVLFDALRNARQGEEQLTSSDSSVSIGLTASELSRFSKSAIVVSRKTRKLASSSSGLDPVSLLEQASIAEEAARSDSWDDMRAIIETLRAYGCVSTEEPYDDSSLEDQTFTLTPAGTNIGMLGLENSLWCLVAVGGAWDVVSASSKLDNFRYTLDAGNDEIDWYDDDKGQVSSTSELPKPQREAESLVSQLRSLPSSELAGYVSSLVADSSRSGGPSVVELFQRLTVAQQRVIQSSLLVMERLVEVQKQFNVDQGTRSCSLDISNCEVVTAWAEGCSWAEALEISSLPPGDLARTLSRALDALRQLGNLPFTPIRKHDLDETAAARTISPGIHPEIRRLCQEAARSINRYPVKDPLAFAATDEEELEEEEGEEDQDEDDENDDIIDEPEPTDE